MEAARVSAVYELGPFRLYPEAGVLTCEGALVPLGPRAIAVLTVLVERAGARTRGDPAAAVVRIIEDGLTAAIALVAERKSNSIGG
jgi:hypothetical protein